MRANTVARWLARLVIAGAFIATQVCLLFGTATAAAKELPEFFTLGRLIFGEQISAPASSSAPAWTFDARAGSQVEISTTGLSKLRLRGPKRLGGNWNTIWNPIVPKAGKVLFKVPRSGRYGIFGTRMFNTQKASVALTCRSASCELPTWPLGAQSALLRVIAVGDTGLQPHRANDDPYGGFKYEEYHLYTEMVEGIERYLDHGDLRIANIETAITQGGKPAKKKFTFRMHPNALDTLVRAGFNGFAMANNHAGDYGVGGITDGMTALLRARRLNPGLGYAGIGANIAVALRPHIFNVKGLRVAFSSVGFGFNFDPNGPYMARLSDLRSALTQIKAVPADIRIMAIHFGSERALKPSVDAQTLARNVIDAGVDVLVGHHPHVVQGLQRRGRGLILFSVGNFLLRGARNMSMLGPDMDFGAAVRLGYDVRERRLRTLELIPLYDMHRVVIPLEPDAARDRIQRVNRRSAALGAGAVKLEIDGATGFGVAHF